MPTTHEPCSHRTRRPALRGLPFRSAATELASGQAHPFGRRCPHSATGRQRSRRRVQRTISQFPQAGRRARRHERLHLRCRGRRLDGRVVPRHLDRLAREQMAHAQLLRAGRWTNRRVGDAPARFVAGRRLIVAPLPRYPVREAEFSHGEGQHDEV